MHDKTQKRLCDDLGQASCLILASVTRAVEDGLCPANAINTVETFTELIREKSKTVAMSAATQPCTHPCQNNPANN